MSSLHLSCPRCGSANEPSAEYCHLCQQLLSQKISHKRTPKLSRRTVLWGVAAGTVALSTGGYLTYKRLTDPHILTFATSRFATLDASWSPDGTRIASAPGVDDAAVQIWNATTGEQGLACKLEHSITGVLPTSLPTGKSSNKQVVWSDDGSYILALVGSPDQQMVQVWNAANGQRMHNFLVQPPPLRTGDQLLLSAWALNTRYLAVAREFITSREYFVEVWDIATGSKIALLESNIQDAGISPGRIYQILAVLWAPDGERLAVCYGLIGNGNLYEIWDAAAGKRISTFISEDNNSDIAWSPDGRFLAHGTVVIDVETGSKVTAYPAQWNTFSLAWSPDGKRIAIAYYIGGRYWVPTYGKFSVFDALSGQELATYDQGRFDIIVAGMGRMAWSPSGKYIMLLNGHIDIWRIDQL